MTRKTNPGLKIICLNRKASFNFFFEDLIEAGIVLRGSEIKSIRDGKVNIGDSYAIEKNGEIEVICIREDEFGEKQEMKSKLQLKLIRELDKAEIMERKLIEYEESLSAVNT